MRLGPVTLVSHKLVPNDIQSMYVEAWGTNMMEPTISCALGVNTFSVVGCFSYGE